MKKILPYFILIFLLGCSKEIDLKEKFMGSQENSSTFNDTSDERNEQNIKKLYGTWSSTEERYSLTIEKTMKNKQIALTLNDADSTILHFDSFDPKYNAYVFSSEKEKNSYRIVVVNESQILFNYATTRENSEGVTQMIELEKE